MLKTTRFLGKSNTEAIYYRKSFFAPFNLVSNYFSAKSRVFHLSTHSFMLKRIFFMALLMVLAVTATQAQSVYYKGSKIGVIESDGDVYYKGSKIAEFESDGDIYYKGSKIGEVESDGDVYYKGSKIGEVESDGDVYYKGSKIGEVESDGDVYYKGSKVGNARGAARWRIAAFYFFYILELH